MLVGRARMNAHPCAGQGPDRHRPQTQTERAGIQATPDLAHDETTSRACRTSALCTGTSKWDNCLNGMIVNFSWSMTAPLVPLDHAGRTLLQTTRCVCRWTRPVVTWSSVTTCSTIRRRTRTCTWQQGLARFYAHFLLKL